MMKTLHWTTLAEPRWKRSARLVAAALLRGASVGLDRLASRLATVPARRSPALEALPSLEFHAEAGAPEGALFVDGDLVGRLPGVTRL
jgi:hypothetical protein